MAQEKKVKVIDVNAENVEQTGFFCFMSKRKSKGYRQKMEWLKARFSEGMRIKMLELPERGFIEYIPGQYAWRAVHAKDYMVIHCLWVIGRHKKKGYGSLLLQKCIDSAMENNMHGVAAITIEKGGWLPKKGIYLKKEFLGQK